MDHDAQIMLFHDATISAHNKCAQMLRNIDEYLLLNFNYNLGFELWEDVFDENEANIAFQTFLNIFIRYFYSSFPISLTRPHINNKAWITSSIKTKCSIKIYIRCKEGEILISRDFIGHSTKL
jgi:hypothetical protein